MALTYHAGRRIQGLAYTASNITKDEDFSKVWENTGTDVSIDSNTNYRLDFNIPNSTNQTDAITHDLTSTSDSAWVLRFKFVMDNYSQNTTGHAKKMCIGLSSASHSTSIDSAQDAIGILFGSWDNGTHKIRSRSSDGGSWQGGSGTDFTESFTDDEVYYVEIKRTSTTAYTVSLYSDSTYSTLIEAETETIASTISGLRYLKVGIDTTANAPDGTFTGYIDDLYFWNGTTSTSGTATYSDDFSSGGVWTEKGSMGVSGGTLTGENVLDGGDDTVYYDLTSTSDTNWILRFKGTYTTTYGTGNASKLLYVGLSSDTNAQNTAKDFAGFIFEQWNLPQFKMSGGVVNNAILEYASTLSNLNALNTSSATTVTNYFEVKRDNDDFTFTVYSNSDYTGQLATVTRTVSSVTTLRYLVLTNRDLSASNTGSLTVSVDDVEFYNDATTAIKTAIGDAKPTNVELGSRFEETDTRKIYFRADSDRSTDKWFEAGTAIPTSGLYAVFGGGYIGSNTNVIDYITVATTGNATDFGDMNTNRRAYGSCASITRGLFGGGYASNYTANIEYITIATPSNGTSFGDLNDTQTSGIRCVNSETRGVFGMGETPYTNRIDYVTIASTGNATDFGDLTASRKAGSSTSDGTKGVFFGGEGSQTTLDYVTIATTGNASSWGGSFSTGTHSGGTGNVNNGTRGVIAIGGSSNDSSYSDIMEYLTITTGSNSTDFGNLTQGRSTPSQASTDTRGVFGGGKFTSGGSSGTVTIDYITIATTGNATDFGDLTQARYIGGGVSDQGGDRT